MNSNLSKRKYKKINKKGGKQSKKKHIEPIGIKPVAKSSKIPKNISKKHKIRHGGRRKFSITKFHKKHNDSKQLYGWKIVKRTNKYKTKKHGGDVNDGYTSRITQKLSSMGSSTGRALGRAINVSSGLMSYDEIHKKIVSDITDIKGYLSGSSSNISGYKQLKTLTSSIFSESNMYDNKFEKFTNIVNELKKNLDYEQTIRLTQKKNINEKQICNAENFIDKLISNNCKIVDLYDINSIVNNTTDSGTIKDEYKNYVYYIRNIDKNYLHVNEDLKFNKYFTTNYGIDVTDMTKINNMFGTNLNNEDIIDTQIITLCEKRLNNPTSNTPNTSKSVYDDIFRYFTILYFISKSKNIRPNITSKLLSITNITVPIYDYQIYETNTLQAEQLASFDTELGNLESSIKIDNNKYNLTFKNQNQNEYKISYNTQNEDCLTLKVIKIPKYDPASQFCYYCNLNDIDSIHNPQSMPPESEASIHDKIVTFIYTHKSHDGDYEYYINDNYSDVIKTIQFENHVIKPIELCKNKEDIITKSFLGKFLSKQEIYVLEKKMQGYLTRKIKYNVIYNFDNGTITLVDRFNYEQNKNSATEHNLPLFLVSNSKVDKLSQKNIPNVNLYQKLYNDNGNKMRYGYNYFINNEKGLLTKAKEQLEIQFTANNSDTKLKQKIEELEEKLRQLQIYGNQAQPPSASSRSASPPPGGPPAAALSVASSSSPSVTPISSPSGAPSPPPSGASLSVASSSNLQLNNTIQQSSNAHIPPPRPSYNFNTSILTSNILINTNEIADMIGDNSITIPIDKKKVKKVMYMEILMQNIYI